MSSEFAKAIRMLQERYGDPQAGRRVWRDAEYMAEAIKWAKHAQDCGQRPFGCVIVDSAGLLAGACGSERLDDPTWHSEVEAIRLATSLRGVLLHECTLYSTHEPCIMCCGAINHAKISRVVWGSQRADMPDLFRTRLPGTHPLALLRDTSHPPEIAIGVLRDECVALFDQERGLC